MGTVFSAYDIRGRADDTLTVEYAWTVGKAFAEWLPDEGSVVIVTSQSVNSGIVHGLTEGILLQGRDVVSCGTGDTQAVVNAISEHGAVGGALVGHDDVQNLETIALFDAHGTAVSAETGLADINQLVDSGNFLPAAEKGTLVTK